MTDDELKANYEKAVEASEKLADELRRRGNKINIWYSTSYCNYFKLSDLTQPWIECGDRHICLGEMLNGDLGHKWILCVFRGDSKKDETFPIYDLSDIGAIADKTGCAKKTEYEQIRLF